MNRTHRLIVVLDFEDERERFDLVNFLVMYRLLLMGELGYNIYT